MALLRWKWPPLCPQQLDNKSVLFDKKLARGARLVGRKIGLTSQAMQQQMGVDQPDYGFLLDTMAVPSGGVLFTKLGGHQSVSCRGDHS
jgi:2-keto-4-pentenoate hydratase